MIEKMGVQKAVLLGVFVFLSLLIFGIISVEATNCWQYNANATCSSSGTGCTWKNDSWGAWCQELSCWSLWNQNDCTTTTIQGKNCSWQGGMTSSYCSEVSCWTFSGTNENNCVNNSKGKNCQWSSNCYDNGASPNANCWSITNQATCANTTGCAWGQCQDKGCWSYNASNTCNAGKDWNGYNCTWDSSGSGYCTENRCWRYSNQTACNAVTGINCKWEWNSCQEIGCWSWDGTNEATCLNNSANLSCSWDGKWCTTGGCWTKNTQNNCELSSSCVWTTWTSGGWCEEVQCWNWDSWKGYNENDCVNNSYNLPCSWSVDPVNASNGWCYKDSSSVSCSNLTTERGCMDTYYCWWQYNDWNNISAGGVCNDPSGWNLGTNNSISMEWNPGCYLFDTNSSNCGSTLGCDNSTAGQCVTNSTHSNANEITANGINCTMIGSSSLCNTLSSLSSCCSWQNNSCTTNKLTTSCWSQISTPPADSCEGANIAEDESTRNINCNSIAGDPWYMPCKWNNNSKMCEFKSGDVFGNGTKSILKIENKKNCEAAGGKWITENYCEGNVSVPSGRCEYKFDEEDNCNKACFGCEKKDSKGSLVNATNARSACVESTLGNCEFSADTNAPNGVGYCNAKGQFKKGVAGDCDIECGSCTYKGSPTSNDTKKRPMYYCTQSKANSEGGGCKWVSDISSIGGYCVKKGEKTCEDACDRCGSQTDCSNVGRTKIANQSGSCKWQGDSNDGSCVPNIGEDVEICWDGTDNDGDGLIDCSDPACYSDTYCGLVSGDCFIYNNSANCNAQNVSCEWITDKWGSWCDFRGASCWKYDKNESYCNSNSNCQWSNGTGNGWCEKDWSVAEVCMGLDQSGCMTLNASGCNWTVDSWCVGQGNNTDWCTNHGGWCDHVDFAPKNCWSYNSGSVACGNVSGCSWRSDPYSMPMCEVNWSANCWQYNTNGTCSASSGCMWKSDSWGAWCTNVMDQCWGYSTQSSCSASSKCFWQSSYSGGGFCQPLCSNASYVNNQNLCSSVQGCSWRAESGWCEETQMASCSNSTNWDNSTSCSDASGCRWRSSGWCDPKGGFSGGAIALGGGVGGAFGADCYKYDGNQTLCTNKTLINISCGWTPEFNPRCEVDWSTNCWQYASEANGCNSTNGCWWNSGVSAGGGWCGNLLDQCWNNLTLQTDAGACNANPYCNSTAWGGCEPTCFSSTTQGACTSGGCRWINGWCNPVGMTSMFNGMESGAPVPLGMDDCSSEGISQASIDICGFGMKDMGDSYGFGAFVNDFSNASICNKEKLSSFVMEMAGGQGVGMGGPTASERVGDGNDTVKYFVYLDTDGLTTGGCSLSHNSSAGGYEFMFRYVSEWNATKAKAAETFTSYKCENGAWKVTDIKISAWKKKMCSEIGGPIIAVQKNDLSKFPTLYDSTADIRVSVATAGLNNNLSSPSDTANPGWTTPGSVDFSIHNAFSYGADTAKFEDILKKGFVVYEDCFNGIDDDGDGNIDCFDWNCQFSDQCTNSGVNSPSYVDTSSPLVVGVKIEEYHDSVLIMYDTNKPTNGTVKFYGTDSTCINLNASIRDIGIIRNDTIRTYKLWHSAPIYNDNSISLAYTLQNNTRYFYKIEICDSGGKCSVSKCSNFTTAESSDKCGYCNFVTRLKVPPGWNVSYDINQDGIYEHLQGYVCGPNAGMKTNYTGGRSVNIKLAKSDGSVYFEFINTTLTKSGLNDKVRTISGSNSLIYDIDDGYVGMPSETRDKIINNLHPEVCRIKIPFSGACDSLYHCDDSGQNCTDRTSDSIRLDQTNCVWQLPYCEFSTWDEDGNPSVSLSSPSSSSSSGGGGGGAGIISAGFTYILSYDDFLAGYFKDIRVNDRFKFQVSDEDHYVKLSELSTTSATVVVTSDPQQATLGMGETAKFELDSDNFYDLSVTLKNITLVNNTATKAGFTIKSISEAKSTSEEESKKETSGEMTRTETKTADEIKEKANLLWLWIVIGIVIVGMAVGIIIKFKDKKIPKIYKYGSIN